MMANRFQSTLSVRRATDRLSALEATVAISIHALRKESDILGGLLQQSGINFNPRSP